MPNSVKPISEYGCAYSGPWRKAWLKQPMARTPRSLEGRTLPTAREREPKYTGPVEDVAPVPFGELETLGGEGSNRHIQYGAGVWPRVTQ